MCPILMPSSDAHERGIFTCIHVENHGYSAHDRGRHRRRSLGLYLRERNGTGGTECRTAVGRIHKLWCDRIAARHISVLVRSIGRVGHGRLEMLRIRVGHSPTTDSTHVDLIGMRRTLEKRGERWIVWGIVEGLRLVRCRNIRNTSLFITGMKNTVNDKSVWGIGHCMDEWVGSSSERVLSGIVWHWTSLGGRCCSRVVILGTGTASIASIASLVGSGWRGGI